MHIVQQFVSFSHTPLLLAAPVPPIALLPARAESLRAREPAPEFRFSDPRFRKLSEQNRLEVFAAAEKLMSSTAKFLNGELSDSLFLRAASRYQNTLARIRHTGSADKPYTPPNVTAMYREMGRETAEDMTAFVEKTFEECANIARQTEEEIAARNAFYERRGHLLRKAGDA